MTCIKYTKEQENFIRQNYTTGTDRQEFAKTFNKKFKTNKRPSALFDKAKRIGSVHRTRNVKKYTQEEEQYILDYYNNPLNGYKFTEAFNKKFKSNRTLASIKNKAAELGKTESVFFTDEELNFLKRNSKKCSRTELMEAFNKKFNKNRSLISIIDACSYRGYNILTKREDGEVWLEKRPDKNDYMRIKLSKSENKLWKKVSGYASYAQYIWWKHTGHIPQNGEAIIYLDNDTTNCNFDNLCLIDKKSFARFRRSGFVDVDHPGLKKMAIKQCQIETVIKEASK